MIIKATDKDINNIVQLSQKTFKQAYTHNEFIDKCATALFSYEKVISDFDNHNIHFFLYMKNKQPIGYLKLEQQAYHDEINSKNPLNLTCIYLLEEYQNNGIGSELMDFVEEWAKDERHDVIWLGVWEGNHKAINFYKKYGYKFITSETFPYPECNHSDTDHIFLKEL